MDDEKLAALIIKLQKILSGAGQDIDKIEAIIRELIKAEFLEEN